MKRGARLVVDSDPIDDDMRNGDVSFTTAGIPGTAVVEGNIGFSGPGILLIERSIFTRDDLADRIVAFDGNFEVAGLITHRRAKIITIAGFGIPADLRGRDIEFSGIAPNASHASGENEPNRDSEQAHDDKTTDKSPASVRVHRHPDNPREQYIREISEQIGELARK